MPHLWGVHRGALVGGGGGARDRGRSTLETISVKCDSGRCRGAVQPHVQFVVTQNDGTVIRVTICGMCIHTTKLVVATTGGSTTVVRGGPGQRRPH